MGYHLAGFKVVGVDCANQPKYPFEFHCADAIEFIEQHGHEFDAIAASPPCQRYSLTERIQNNDHPDLIGPMRNAILKSGKPYVIENVEEARKELIDPILLCGNMFPELNVYRHRLFEAGNGFSIVPPMHGPHLEPIVKMGRPPQAGHRMHVVGNFSGVKEAKKAMGIDWMTRDGLRESIPPAYTNYIGMQLLAHLQKTAVGISFT